MSSIANVPFFEHILIQHCRNQLFFGKFFDCSVYHIVIRSKKAAFTRILGIGPNILTPIKLSNGMLDTIEHALVCRVNVDATPLNSKTSTNIIK